MRAVNGPHGSPSFQTSTRLVVGDACSSGMRSRYAARGASDKDLGNSYYDAKYLFSASYVGRIATLVNDQAIACRAVFPYVELFGSSPA